MSRHAFYLNVVDGHMHTHNTYIFLHLTNCSHIIIARIFSPPIMYIDKWDVFLSQPKCDLVDLCLKQSILFVFNVHIINHWKSYYKLLSILLIDSKLCVHKKKLVHIKIVIFKKKLCSHKICKICPHSFCIHNKYRKLYFN